MEKLKAKHDHKLTDILKVIIFGLFLLMPGIIILPSMMYYGVNKYATAPTEEVEIYEYKQIDFNQYFDINTTAFNTNQLTTAKDINTYTYTFTGTPTSDVYLTYNFPADLTGHYIVVQTFTYNEGNSISYLFTPFTTLGGNNSTRSRILVSTQNSLVLKFFANQTINVSAQFQIFDLTQMFGAGNEPGLTAFNTYFPNNFYKYTESEIKTLEIDTGRTETYTDITSQIQYNWTSLWKQPLFSWTNYTALKQGLDNFTGVFGITNTSNISNLITYELIIVAVYIVIDIVLTLFKWLTHLIGEK